MSLLTADGTPVPRAAPAPVECKRCDRLVVLLPLTNGRRRPFDHPAYGGSWRLIDGTAIDSPRSTAPGPRYTPHRCPGRRRP